MGTSESLESTTACMGNRVQDRGSIESLPARKRFGENIRGHHVVIGQFASEISLRSATSQDEMERMQICYVRA